MRARTLWRIATSLAVLGLGARSAKAVEGVRIDQMQPAAPESPFFRAEGPHQPMEQVEFAVGLTLDYAGTKLVRAVAVTEAGDDLVEAAPVENAVLLHVGGSLTPIHWMNIDLNLPIGLLETGEADQKVVFETVKATAAGVGDPRIGFHVRPIDALRLGWIVGARFWAPIGSTSAYLSDGEFRLELDTGIAGRIDPWLYGCTLAVAPRFFATQAGDRIGVSCAGHYQVTEMVSLGLEPAFALFKDLGPREEATYLVQFEPLAAARISLGDFRFGAGIGPGFGAAVGTAQFRGLLSVAYVGAGKPPPPPPPPPPPDRDLDKIIDSEDACPTEAGPDNSDAARRGCPSRDRDGDRISDEKDYCPDRPGIAHSDPKANGCPDSDNDTLPDPIDECRNEPGAAPAGCPKYARLGKDTFVVTPPIDFRDYKLAPESRAALEEIAATMRANPKIEQVSIGLGTKGARPALSDKRAQEITLALRGGNLDASRFEILLRDDLRAGTVEIKVLR